jgi:hypothetical protein
MDAAPGHRAPLRGRRLVCLPLAARLYAAGTFSHARDVLVQGGVLVTIAGLTWFLAGGGWGITPSVSESTRIRPYLHVLIPLLSLAVLAVVAGMWTGGELVDAKVRAALAERLTKVELFVSRPTAQVITGAMFMGAVARVITSTPGRLLFLPAFAVLWMWREWVMFAFFVTLAFTLVPLAFASLNARFSAAWNVLHGLFFGGWATLVSTAVIVLGLARVADIQYVSTVFDGAKSRTILGYLLFAYVLAWWYDYWTASGSATRLLQSLGTPGNQDAQLDYPYAGPQLTGVPPDKRRIQLHAAGRLLVYRPPLEKKEPPFFHSYTPVELIDALADDLPTTDELRPELQSLRWRVEGEFLRTAAIFIGLLVGAGLALRSLEQKPIIVGDGRHGAYQADAMLFGGGCDKPIIAIAASGGGTRAALYTTSVLERLYSRGHLGSVRLLSGVSGGGAALAYFAAHYQELVAPNAYTAWDRFYDAMQASYIGDVIDGSGEWRIAQGDRLGQLLAESFDREWGTSGRYTMGDVSDLGLILNSSIAGRTERQGQRRAFSDVAGGRVIYTNLDLPDHFAGTNAFMFDGDEPTRDRRLPVFVIRDRYVRLSSAAAANANFPPVFSNIPVEHPETRLWATDGGAIDNRGTETLLMAVRHAMAASRDCAKTVPVHVIEAEASGFSDAYSQDRGFGSAMSAGSAFASQLDAELLEAMRKDFGANVRFYYVPMPSVLRRSGSFGTHWMMQDRIPVCLQEPCGDPVVLNGTDVITVLRRIDDAQLPQEASDNAKAVHERVRSPLEAEDTENRARAWREFLRCFPATGQSCPAQQWVKGR